MSRLIYKEWLLQCEGCSVIMEHWAWSNELPMLCPQCGESNMMVIAQNLDRSAGIIPDGIPGGVEIRHLGPKPERFYSRTDIKRACNERGFNWADDTPGKYKVHWSGIEKKQ